ncbi:alpha-amylase family glycosyl hydrolase [Pontibacter sp. SGAir0037]|uniref:alpha-amylase family glycosyl hydrolase n=1 Tax=Pontibacter sp. SGAir0037 TaxID=2571030 RepID=UPI0010CD5B61|nr:alpha-amylase family glycosyl hydrolase [Pontibacter sp. SGAir0037]QCR23112.1 alpha-amylase [Pontibacter sp. SGAir0037]
MKKTTLHYAIVLLLLSFVSGCNRIASKSASTDKVSDWPRGVTYEIFVQSFCDSDNDGIGDIKGMTSKLDYLKDLGVEAVWLMPMSPSPSYHKYDVVDYYGIHPDYGTLADFKEFVNQAHARGIHVVIDLVLNHSGVDHPWFQEAARNPESRLRDYYVWAHQDDPQTQKKGKIIAGDSDNENRWHRIEGSEYLYYGYFYGGMPDLNYDNPALREEVFKIGRFWLSEVGVDGFRLDAARHIFPDDRPEDNHRWWVEFKQEMQKVKPDVYLVGEVWADAATVAPYTKGLHALFNFDMSYAMTNAARQERIDSLVIKLAQIRKYYNGVNPDFIDASFLTNHDQNRIMSELNGDLNKAKMASALLLTLPGSPYIYYGEEIGMTGKKPDEHIREPFIWEPGQEDNCRATWLEPRFSTEQTVSPVAVQLQNENSLLNHYKTFIQLRNSSKALTFGELEPVQLNNGSVGAFLRTHSDETLLVLHNLSGAEASVKLPDNLQGYTKPFFQSKDFSFQNSTLRLQPYATLILKK